jgi:uncharacterized protein YndB with AHSA1/START domain
MKATCLLRLLPLFTLPSLLTGRPAPARAEVKTSAAHTLVVEHKLSTTAEPARLYRALSQVNRWWSSKHTFSGSAANLSLRTDAGGCFCERWKDGSVEHGRVIQTTRDKLVRLSTALGPMIDMAVTGVLTFQLEPRLARPEGPGGSDLLVIMRVSGDPSHALAALATPVDGVIGEQAARLVRFVETGKPEQGTDPVGPPAERR